MDGDDLEPGKPLYLVQYGRLSADVEGRRETGPLRIVGTELTHLATSDAYYRVRAPDGQDGWIWSARVTPSDPRQFYSIRNRSLTGYLVGGMHDDQSGGSCSELILTSDQGLGELRVEIWNVDRISIDAAGGAEIALGDGGRFGGTLLRTWLVGGGVRICLDKARSLIVERVRGMVTATTVLVMLATSAACGKSDSGDGAKQEPAARVEKAKVKAKAEPAPVSKPKLDGTKVRDQRAPGPDQRSARRELLAERRD